MSWSKHRKVGLSLPGVVDMNVSCSRRIKLLTRGLSHLDERGVRTVEWTTKIRVRN